MPLHTPASVVVHCTHSPAAQTPLPAMWLQSAFPMHALHVPASQREAVAVIHVEFIKHCTQVFDVVSQSGVGAEQCGSPVH